MAESCTPSTCEETDTGEEYNSIASCSTSATTLDKLRAPKHSEICRKWKVLVGKKRSVCVQWQVWSSFSKAKSEN